MSIVDPPKVWAPCPLALYKESRLCLVDGEHYVQLSQPEYDTLAVLVDARLKKPQDPPRFSNQALIEKSGWSRADKIFADLAAHPFLVDILSRAFIQYRGNGFVRTLGSAVEYSFQR